MFKNAGVNFSFSAVARSIEYAPALWLGELSGGLIAPTLWSRSVLDRAAVRSGHAVGDRLAGGHFAECCDDVLGCARDVVGVAGRI